MLSNWTLQWIRPIHLTKCLTSFRRLLTEFHIIYARMKKKSLIAHNLKQFSFFTEEQRNNIDINIQFHFIITRKENSKDLKRWIIFVFWKLHLQNKILYFWIWVKSTTKINLFFIWTNCLYRLLKFEKKLSSILFHFDVNWKQFTTKDTRQSTTNMVFLIAESQK